MPNKASRRLIRGRSAYRGSIMDETPQGLRDRIAHLHQLYEGVTDRQVKDAIAKMIEELERRLQGLESRDP